MKDNYEAKGKSSSKMFSNRNVMDYLVITCIISILIFTSTVLFFYYKDSMPPPEQITTLFFSFFGGELIAMAGITITGKIVKRKEEYDMDIE